MLRRRLANAKTAMEGTVLRVPRLASERQVAPATMLIPRQSGFWRSSVRRLGPPPSSRGPTSRGRLPPHGTRSANGALDLPHLVAEPVPLRVERSSALTRSHLAVAVPWAAARVEAGPRAGTAADKSARLLIMTSNLRSSQPSETRGMGRFKGVSGRF
jgi:hypothetical protein